MPSYVIPATGTHDISLSQAIDMTSVYREKYNDILKEEFQNQGILALNETFNADDVKVLLEQPEAAGLRIYYGMSGDLKVHAILVGVDKEGNDLLPSPESSPKNQILEDSVRCPIECPPESPLNS